MSKPFISELHDIGKLVDKKTLAEGGLRLRGHTYHKFVFNQLGIPAPSSPSWWGQWSEEGESLEKVSKIPDITDEGKACVLITNIADELAACISRTWGLKGDIVDGVRLLWNPDFYNRQGKHWAAFRTQDDLKEMFTFIDSCESPEEFFAKYDEQLRLRAEDESVPQNFVPLGTHLDLTGKVFRVLRYWSSLVQHAGRLKLQYDGQPIETVTEAAGDRWEGHNKGKWVFRLAKCWIQFPQAMARLQDLNVLRLRHDRIEQIVKGQDATGDVERQPYSVLFHTDDFLLIFLPKETLLSLEEVVKPLLEERFWLECEELEAELNLLTSTGERTRKQLISNKWGTREEARKRRRFELRHIAVWPELDRDIKPHLCDLCQLRHGDEYVSDQVREWLCPVCRKIRDEMGEPARAYAAWEELGHPAAWFKVSLDQELLLGSLHRLFENYVDTGPGMDRVDPDDKKKLKDGFRPLAAQMEFVRQYQEFLGHFRRYLGQLEGSKGQPLLSEGETLLYPIEGYQELGIVRLDDEQTLGYTLDTFLCLLTKYFPACLTDFPIRLSVSLANVKYPYHEHWRFFQMQHSPGIIFHIQQPGVRELELTSSQYEAMRGKLQAPRLTHFLHRLADVESEAGQMMALFQALEQRRRFPQIQELMVMDGLTFQQILDFYRLVGLRAEKEVTNV